MTAADWALLTSTFLASFVECVEALTIVLAMGITRGWRAAIAGTVSALVAVAVFTVAAGYALATWLPTAALQLVVGLLMLIFGLQWLRKAILRSAGLKSVHDQEAEYAEQTAVGRDAERRTIMGLDAFGYIVSLKAVFLEGVEVTFIVITFGLNADNVPLASLGGGAAALVVLLLGASLHRPLAAVPENTLKYAVGLMLATFGTFWSLEGIGVFAAGGRSLEWPGGDWALVGLLTGWLIWSRLLIRWLRRRADQATRADEAPVRV
ncbi:MAG: TMEM165/GDT1 family protein [Propionibacteriales bacterium]|nr:TMEM165/GDT1 family protein [Propionibacteriales bacterium]